MKNETFAPLVHRPLFKNIALGECYINHMVKKSHLWGLGCEAAIMISWVILNLIQMFTTKFWCLKYSINTSVWENTKLKLLFPRIDHTDLRMNSTSESWKEK